MQKSLVLFFIFCSSEVKVKLLSHVRLFATLWAVAYRVPPPMEFSRKNTGVGCHFLLQFCSKQATMYWLQCILQPFLRVRNNFCYGIFPYFITLIKLLISVPNTAI